MAGSAAAGEAIAVATGPGLVSVIIVNWNGGRSLPDVLQAVHGQRYEPIEIIVIDNGSIDSSIALLEADPSIRLIKNARNLGFAEANNQAIAVAGGEFVLLLNNDAILTEDYIGTLVADMRQDETRGSASGKLLRPANGSSGPTIDSVGHVMYRNLWPTNRGEGEPDGPAFDHPGEVFGVCAAAGLYRRAMLDDVAVDGEVFDSSFFAYLEDVDLDWRARLRGWRSWYDPRVTAYHQRGGTGLWFSTRIQRHILKNRILMGIKNDAGPQIYRRLPGMAAFTAAKGLQVLVTRPGALLGFVDVIRLLPATWRKRRIIQANRTARPAALESWYEPYPYVRKIREGRLGRSRRPSRAEPSVKRPT
jgi:GT2 family glycosyltransferase